MKNVEAIDVVTFGAGNILKLSEKQAGTRKNFLLARGDGVFETIGEIQFKRGETFGVEGPISKAMLESVNIDGKPGKPMAPEKPKNQGPVKFVMPEATDTPAAQQARLDKLTKKGK
jgi:hypothetical protein